MKRWLQSCELLSLPYYCSLFQFPGAVPSSDSDPDVLGRLEWGRGQTQLQDIAAVAAVGVSSVAAVGVSVVVAAVDVSVVAAVAGTAPGEHKPDSNPSTEILWRAEKSVSRPRLWVEHRLVNCPFVGRKGGPV